MKCILTDKGLFGGGGERGGSVNYLYRLLISSAESQGLI